MQPSTIVGSIGVALLLLAFGLTLFGRLDTKSRTYALLNFAGAVIAGYASWMIDYLPFVVLEGCWAVVALVGLVRSARR